MKKKIVNKVGALQHTLSSRLKKNVLILGQVNALRKICIQSAIF